MSANNSNGFLFEPFTLSDLYQMELPEQDYIVDTLIPVGLTAISGPSGVGKSWLLHHLATCITSGQPVFDQFDVQQSGVLILDKENQLKLIKDRFQKLHAESKLPIYFEHMSSNLINQEYISAILTSCKMYEIRLVMFDALIRFHNANENDASEMSNIFGLLKQLVSKNISVIFLQHHRKESRGGRGNHKESMRGTSDFSAAVDCHLAVEKKDDTLTITQEKLRGDKELEEKINILLDSNEPGLVKMTYIGSDRKRGSKEENLKKEIVKILTDGPRHQKAIHEALEAKDIHIAKNSLATYLKRMLAEHRAVCMPGPRNSKIYSLPNNVALEIN